MSQRVICHYRVQAGKEAEFEALLDRHWPTLQRLGLVTDELPVHYQGIEQDNGQPIYFELFEWREGAVEKAHQQPEIMAIWEPMEQLCEARGGKPSMEFPHVRMLGTTR